VEFVAIFDGRVDGCSLKGGQLARVRASFERRRFRAPHEKRIREIAFSANRR
jgi:hypothetical protein